MSQSIIQYVYRNRKDRNGNFIYGVGPEGEYHITQKVGMFYAEKVNGLVGVGVSKLHPNDKFNREPINEVVKRPVKGLIDRIISRFLPAHEVVHTRYKKSDIGQRLAYESFQKSLQTGVVVVPWSFDYEAAHFYFRCLRYFKVTSNEIVKIQVNYPHGMNGSFESVLRQAELDNVNPREQDRQFSNGESEKIGSWNKSEWDKKFNINNIPSSESHV